MAIRFGLQAGSDCESFVEDSDEQFVAAVEWRDSKPGLAKQITQDPALKTIGMCWKQQCKSKGLNGKFQFALLHSLQSQLPSLLKTVRDEVLIKASQSRKVRVPNDTASNRLQEYLENHSDEVCTNPLALLASIELLCGASHQFPAKIIGQLWRCVLAGAISQAESLQQALDIEWHNIDEDSLSNHEFLIQAGLLPWICGVLFDEVKGAPKLAKAGRKGLRVQLESLTDSSGALLSVGYAYGSFLLAVWRDAAVVGESFNQAAWKGVSKRRFERFLKCSASLLRSDGCLAVPDGQPHDAEVLASLAGVESLETSIWEATSRDVVGKTKLKLLRSASHRSKSKSRTPTTRYSKKTTPSWQSDESETACLRTSWSAHSSLISLAHGSAEHRLQLVCGGLPLLCGDWDIAVSEDGDDLEFDESWECCCWYSDREVDYCEIQLEFEGGPELCRHVLIHRTQQYAILSDIVTSSQANVLSVESLLPLAEGIDVSKVAGTREHKLKFAGGAARVYPLALPQDAGLGTSGVIEETEDGELRVGQQNAPDPNDASGSNEIGMFSPIIIDWNPARAKESAEWSRLTITEAGEVDKSGAMGYRLRVGDLHLVLYRQLRKTERYRTMLGEQTSNETIIAEFTKQGDLRELLLVE